MNHAQLYGFVGFAALIAVNGCTDVVSPPITDGGTDGTVAVPVESSCQSTYDHWFESDFEYPDGGVVGSANFPNSPWGVVSGTPTIADGALAAIGSSTTVASQGGELPKDGLRLRYRVVFRGAGDEVTVGINADVNGNPTVGAAVSASDGTFAVVDGGSNVASETLGALDPNAVFFVEVELEAVGGRAWLSRDNYATVPGSVVLAALDFADLTAPAGGKYVSATLAPSDAISPEIDDVTVSRCGSSPPDYEDVFVDAFERDTLNDADFPTDSTWDPHGAVVSMIGGAARLMGFSLGPRAKAVRAIGNEEARLRAVVRFGSTDAWPRVIWGVSGAPQGGEQDLGFVLWNNGDEGRVILRGYGGGIETAFADAAFEVNTRYFVEVVADGRFAVATVRTLSFTGPVYVATATDDVTSPGTGQDEVGFGNSGAGTVFVDEMALSQYVSGL